MMQKCIYCLRRLCLGNENICLKPCSCNHRLPEALTEDEYAIETENEFHWQKLAGTLKDPASTGRKRAAKLYPLDSTKDCDWAMQHYCGGGEIPIPGCGLRIGSNIGQQCNRHHGPDYNPTNNAPNNVHRICASCHNAWHSKNDPYKDVYYLKMYGHKVKKGRSKEKSVWEDGTMDRRDGETNS